METKWIDANGIRFLAKTSGREGAPWLTFSNSLATNHTMWDGQADAFANDFRILQYDTRGHGETDAPDGPYTWDQLTGDVVGLWDALGIDCSHFVGLSLGGMTGIGLALDHASRLLSLTACDCRSDAPEMFQNMWDQRCAGIDDGGIASTLDMTLATWFTESFRNGGVAAVGKVSDMILTTPVAGYLGCVAALRQLDFKKRLPEIGVPTLFMVGEFDGPHPAEMKSMHKLVAGSQYRVIDGAAHISNMEKPERFNENLREFLGSN